MPARGYVRVRIREGLGNQMFQYATGLGVAQRLGVPLYCDVSWFLRRRKRKLELRSFGLTLAGTWRGNVEALGLLKPDPAARLITDGAEFVPEVMTTGAPVRLNGWYQSWRYFAHVPDQVRAAFDFERIALGPAAGAVLSQIRAAPNSVAVHVRHGDYRRFPRLYVLLGSEHYARARARIEAEVAAPRYFVFSSEAHVAAQLVGDWPGATLVTGTSTTEDFRLMASCDHFLVANSTFSWWAAWLGRSPDKRVIAPEVWYGDGFGREIDYDARLPPDWIRV